MTRAKIHKYIYLFSLCTLVFFMPVSEYVTSIAIWIMVTNWLFEGKFKEKIYTLKKDKSIGIFLILFFVPVLWLFNTVNLQFAFNDLRIKLPLLIFPLIIGTSNKLGHKEVINILRCFVLGLLISTVSGLFAYWGIINFKEIDNFRHISIFISHIRLSLMLCLAIFAMIYLLEKSLLKNRIEKFFALSISIWFFVFLFIIQAFTGFIILFIVGFILLIIKLKRTNNTFKKKVIFFVIIIVPFSLFLWLGFFIKDFYTPTNTFDESIEKTAEGNAYYHDYDSRLIENGNYIYRYISEAELYKEWTKRSDMSLDSYTHNGQEMLQILLRYLTSKGLTKDAEGVKALTEEDITAIENGFANYRFVHNSFITKRLYTIIWQIDVYIKGGNPSGHSVTQRFEYIKAALILTYQNFWLGTGTGDIDDEYKKHYVESRSILKPDFRHRAHNQYLTFFISFGVFGAFLCFIALFVPIIINKAYRNYYFCVFIGIALLSMLNEDTIETMIGVVFFSFFYSLFMYGYKSEKQESI